MFVFDIVRGEGILIIYCNSKNTYFMLKTTKKVLKEKDLNIILIR